MPTTTQPTREEILAAIEGGDLTTDEENVLRMRYGIPVRGDHPLTHSNDPQVLHMEAELLAALRERGLISIEG